MSLETPTTAEIAENIVVQLQTALNQKIPLLPKGFIRVLSVALAGVFILLYKYAGFMFLQMFVSQATYAETEINGETVRPLVEWGRLIGIGDPAPATRAELNIEIEVYSAPGPTLPAGTQFYSSDNGVTYLLTSAVTLTTVTTNAVVRASSDESGGGGAGAVGNLEAGAELALINPPSTVIPTATVLSQAVTGADQESEDAYRERVVERFSAQPQGGAYADYRQWGEEPAGIANVYPYTSDCPGQVDVYVEATPESSGSPDGIPTAAQLQEVLDSIELDSSGLATRRPANALANTFAITRNGWHVEITNLVVDDEATVKADIETALEEYFLSFEPYILGLDVPPRNDRVTQSGVSGVIFDVVSAAGGIFNSAILKDSGSVVTDVYTLGIGEKAKLLSVTYP